MSVRESKKKHDILPRKFTPLGGEEPDLLCCERCGKHRVPSKFQPNPTSYEGKAGFVRRRYCSDGCGEKKPAKKITYKELLAENKSLKDENKEIASSMAEIIYRLEALESKEFSKA